MKRVITIFLITTCFFYIKSQGQTFRKTYGGKGYDIGSSLIETPSKDIIITGNTSSDISGSNDIFILKIDSNGIYKLANVYGGNGIDIAHSIDMSADGYFIITGYSNSFNGDYNVYVVKSDTQGSLIWEKNYGGTDWDISHDIIALADSSFVIAGCTYSYGNGNSDAYILKINKDGDTLWTRTYGSTGDEEAFSITQTNDGGLAIAGVINNSNSKKDIQVIKTDNKGLIIWSKTYGGKEDEEAFKILQTDDNGFAIAGYTNSFGDSGSYDFYLIKTDSLGDTLWTRTYGSYDTEKSFSMALTTDRGFAITGLTKGPGYHNIYLFITDRDGYYKKSTTFGVLGKEYNASCIRHLSNNGFAITGNVHKGPLGLTDILLIKTDSTGLTPGSITDSTIVWTMINNSTRNESKFYSYPNPAKHELNFILPLKIQTIKLSIFNMEGKELSTEFNLQYSENNIKILPKENIKPGIFAIRMLINGEREYNTTFLLQ